MRSALLPAIFAAAALVGTVVSTAHADNDYDVSVGGGKVTVTAHTGWHINQEFPWKLTVGDQKLDKSHFTLAKTTATLDGAPKGSGMLRGAICSDSKCVPFHTNVVIK